jgi:hypothetical protein
MQTYKSYGYLKYDPISETTRQDPWWLVVMCPMGLALFYQWLIEREASKIRNSKDLLGVGDFPVMSRGVRVHKSVWGPHISLVRGEKPLNKKAWNKYDGKKVYFEYTPMVGTNGCHYWLPVYSDEFVKIREELGLSKEPRAPFHFTIGRDIESPPSKQR